MQNDECGMMNDEHKERSLQVAFTSASQLKALVHHSSFIILTSSFKEGARTQ